MSLLTELTLLVGKVEISSSGELIFCHLVTLWSANDGMFPLTNRTLSIGSFEVIRCVLVGKNVTSFRKVGICWFDGEVHLVLRNLDILFGKDGYCSDLYLCQLTIIMCHFFRLISS